MHDLEPPRGVREVLTLQYLRGVAAMAVALYHVLLNLEHYNDALSLKTSRFGAAGVDLFFVISGFIMLYITVGTEPGPLRFLKARLLRVLPLYWLVTFAMFVMPLVSRTIGWSSTLNPRHLLTSLLCIGGVHWPAADGDYPVYRAGWTINYEIFFYVVFAMALIVRPVMGSAMVACGILVALVALGYVAAAPVGLAGFYSAPILLEFVFGMAIAAWYLRGRHLPPWLGWVFAIGGVLVLYFVADTPERVFLRGLPASGIVIGVLSLEPLACARPIPLMKLLGDASYSIYLTHLFTLPAIDIVWRKILPHMSAELMPIYIAVGAVVAGLGGIASFYLVERPLHRWARRQSTRTTPKAPSRRDAELNGTNMKAQQHPS